MVARPSFTLENVAQFLTRRTIIVLSVSCFIIFSLITASHLFSYPLTISKQAVAPQRPSDDVSSKLGAKAQTAFDGKWNFQRDRKNFVLSASQCDQAFPELYADLDRAVKERHGKQITLQEMDSIPLRNGYVRGMIYNQQLFVIAVQGEIYSRHYATLLAMNRAITSSPEPLPNIEFTFSVDDWLPPVPQWALARKEDDKQTWLMPDFGYWSWPETKVGSYGEVQEKALEMETSPSNPTGKAWNWADKIPKLLWRGATMGLPLREKLLKVTEGKDWADVRTLDWHNKESTDRDLKSMAEHCQYKYLVNTAGNSYSGRLKYIQNCRSVVIMHEMEWFTHYTHLMKADGAAQNYVHVKADFSDLPKAIEGLVRNDTHARRVADNNVKMFREHYLTPAAEACYWRKLIRTWAEISFEPEFYKEVDGKKVWRGLPVESYVLERKLEWEPH